MKPSVAVLILCQPSETAVTALTLHHLARDLEPQVRVEVLMNGGFVGALEALVATRAHIGFHSSVANLGVAGGRNFLLRLPSARTADLVVILDNDVITPPGHLGRLTEALLDDPLAGVVGPGVLNLPWISDRLGLDSELRRFAPIDNGTLGGLGATLEDERAWFHLGTNPDWQAAYLDEVQLDQRLATNAGASSVPFHAMNHHNPAIRRVVAARTVERVSAANVAGCCQIFRRELLDEIGMLRDEFSPYGFEDVDFCVRALNAGRRNYVVPSILMLHGTDRRHGERSVGAQVAHTQRNFMRCKALFAWHHRGPVWPSVIEASIVRRYALTCQTGSHRAATQHLRAHVAGALDARRQIHHLVALTND